jgi:hypothetical protein
MATKGEISTAYNNCLAEVCHFLNKKGYRIEYRGLKYDSNSEELIIRCVEPFYFQAWPYRGAGGQTVKIDIIAEIEETVRLSDRRCTRATLRVNYFTCRGEKRTVCDAIHYDFSADVQARHPVCHAQATSSILSSLPEGFPEDRDVTPIAGRHQAIRIPSAFVNFAGLFAKVVADHLPSQTVSEFWTDCKVHIDKIPDHATTDPSNCVFTAKSLRSYSWYKW